MSKRYLVIARDRSTGVEHDLCELDANPEALVKAMSKRPRFQDQYTVLHVIDRWQTLGEAAARVVEKLK
jgi:hypothetical protein